MINTIISFVIVALVILGLVDGILYLAVKIKEKRLKRNEIPDGAADHEVSASPSGMSDRNTNKTN